MSDLCWSLSGSDATGEPIPFCGLSLRLRADGADHFRIWHLVGAPGRSTLIGLVACVPKTARHDRDKIYLDRLLQRIDVPRPEIRRDSPGAITKRVG